MGLSGFEIFPTPPQRRLGTVLSTPRVPVLGGFFVLIALLRRIYPGTLNKQGLKEAIPEALHTRNPGNSSQPNCHRGRGLKMSPPIPPRYWPEEAGRDGIGGTVGKGRGFGFLGNGGGGARGRRAQVGAAAAGTRPGRGDPVPLPGDPVPVWERRPCPGLGEGTRGPLPGLLEALWC